MPGPLDDLATATAKGWETVARAWIDAANDVTVAWLELAYTESDIKGFNEARVIVPARPAGCHLYPETFADVDGNQLPANAIDVTPPYVPAGQDTEVCVRVEPPLGTASGTYSGKLCDSPGGNHVGDVGVYVVGDNPP